MNNKNCVLNKENCVLNKDGSFNLLKTIEATIEDLKEECYLRKQGNLYNDIPLGYVQESLVEVTILHMLLTDANKTLKWRKFKGKDLFHLLLLYRRGYQDIRTIQEFLAKKKLNKFEEQLLCEKYVSFKIIDDGSLLTLFLDKRGITKCERILKKLKKEDKQ